MIDKAGRYFLEHSKKDPCDVFNDFCDEFNVGFTDKEAFKLLDMFMKLSNIDDETCEYFLNLQKDEDKMQ